ncbi:hypothetical protein BGZ91_011234, partial [Linnemannia elongata]
MSRQHHRSLSTPPTGFYDIMEFFTSGSQNRGMAKVRRAHTTATTTPTLTAPGKRTSLQSPLLCPHLVNVYKDPCTRSNSTPDVHGPSPTPNQVSTIFRTLFKSQSVMRRPGRHDSLSSKSLPWHPPLLEQLSCSFHHSVSVSDNSQQPTADATGVDAPNRQPHYHSSSPSLRGDCLYRSSESSATNDQRIHNTLALPLTSEELAIVLTPLSMQVLLELLALIVSKGSESFSPSYSDDFALFIQPHGKSYKDLVNLLPRLSRELMTKVVVAARHWARCEDVEVVGRRRRRYSIEDCSRDDLSLSGFGSLTPQELPPLPDPNRACLQNLAGALFSNNLSSSIAQLSGNTITSHGAAQIKYMKDHRIQRSTEGTLQRVGSTEVEINGKDAMEALENLMLLHESVDQLESWKKFSDAHAALPLPPWRSSAAMVEKMALVGQEKKTKLLRKSSRGHSVCKTVRGQAQPQPHDVSALIPPVPSRKASLCTLDKGLCTLAKDGISADDTYNYKTSYWQFKHRQDRARQDFAPGPCSPHRLNPMATATEPLLATAQHLDKEREAMSVDDETCLSGSLNSDSLIDSSDSFAQSSQRDTPATTPQLKLVEFIAPPMKDLYSAPIVMNLSKLSSGARSPVLSGSISCVAAPKRYVTAAIDTTAIKAATKKRPPPSAFPSPPSSTVLSKSMTTTSLSPRTAESFITKISTQPLTEQDGEECLVTVKRGWRIYEKPFMHWKRKSTSAVPAAASSCPDTSAPSVSSSVNRANLAHATPRTSSPIPINTVVTSTHIAAGTASTFPGSTNPSKRLGLGFSIQTQNESSHSKASRPNLNILIKESTSAASLPSSSSFTSQDGSLTSTSSPGLGCSIESIPFPEDYKSMVLSPSSSASALWAALPSIPTPTVPNGSSPRVDNFRMVTSISPLPSPSFTSAGSRRKRFQEKLFGKKSKLPLDDTCSFSYHCPSSPSIHSNRMNVHHAGVAGAHKVVGGVGASGGGVGSARGGNGPVLKSSSSFGSLREKKSFGQLIAPLVFGPLEQRGILKTRSRSSSSASVTAVGTACTIRGQDP